MASQAAEEIDGDGLGQIPEIIGSIMPIMLALLR